MEYGEFLQCVKERTLEAAGEGGTVTINHIIKNNGCELDGLVIMEEGSNISPTIYLNSFYNAYANGRELEDIICEIVNIYTNNKDKISVTSDYFLDFENIREKIVYKIVNYEKNKKLLEKIPFKRILDLAVVFYCIIEQGTDSNATALIYNSHLTSWNVTEEDIYNAAIENTPILLKSTIRSMSSIVQELMDDSDDISDYEDGEMFVLTNNYRINGAACMLYDDVLYNFAQKIDCNLYILPSSIHEIILLPKLPEYNKADLEHMVREVNAESVSHDEILSDRVYVYDRNTRMISL